MKTKPVQKTLTPEQIIEFKTMFAEMSLTVRNNASMMKSGFDVAVQKPQLLDRVGDSVEQAQQRISQALDTFAEQVRQRFDIELPRKS